MNVHPDLTTKRLTDDRFPSLAPDRTHPAADDAAPLPPDEALVTDARASLTPAQMVERKLVKLMRGHALPISHVQMLYTGMSRR